MSSYSLFDDNFLSVHDVESLRGLHHGASLQVVDRIVHGRLFNAHGADTAGHVDVELAHTVAYDGFYWQVNLSFVERVTVIDVVVEFHLCIFCGLRPFERW